MFLKQLRDGGREWEREKEDISDMNREKWSVGKISLEDWTRNSDWNW